MFIFSFIEYNLKKHGEIAYIMPTCYVDSFLPKTIIMFPGKLSFLSAELLLLSTWMLCHVSAIMLGAG